MNYKQSLHYLNSFLNLEKIDWSKSNRTWNLDRMKYLLDLFDHPEKSFFSVIIAGTKGKGSTGFFLESLLKVSEIPTGFYCSPHLIEPTERIRLNGKTLEKHLWVNGLKKIKQVLSRKKHPAHLGHFTYFEITTLLAALVFKKKKVKIALFEVGMGGRLDATNAFGAKLALMTPIHMDHEDILGDTITKIAAEKAAVINPRADVVCSKQLPLAMQVIKKKVTAQKANLFYATDATDVLLGLEGHYQRMNAGVATKAAERLKERWGFDVKAHKRERALKCDAWPARFEVIQKHPKIVMDGAHNPAATRALVRYLQTQRFSNERILIFGTQRDKQSEQMLKNLSHYFDTLVLVQAKSSRSQEVQKLVDDARKYFAFVFPLGHQLEEAISFSKEIVGSKGFILITGSFHLIGEMKKVMQHG